MGPVTKIGWPQEGSNAIVVTARSHLINRIGY